MPRGKRKPKKGSQGSKRKPQEPQVLGKRKAKKK